MTDINAVPSPVNFRQAAFVQSASAVENAPPDLGWEVAFAGRSNSATSVVSVMHANNEIGVVNDIAGIGEICRERGVIYHVDAAQSTGKLPLDMETMKVDLLSISAHKMYGPKGIGALYVRRKPRVRIEAQMHGGGHERGMRSGTLATHQIVGLGEAARIANAEMQAEGDRLKALRQRFWDAINDIPEVHMNGSRDHRLPGALNVSFAFVEGESLLMSLKDLAISSGSACTSASLEPSYVLWSELERPKASSRNAFQETNFGFRAEGCFTSLALPCC